MESKLPSIKILGINITTSSESEVLEYIVKKLKKRDKKFYIATPNPEILVAASRSSRLKDILNDAEVSLPDGVGITLSGRMLKNRKIPRITGVDFMEKLCAKCAEHGLTVGFFGGRDGVAEKTAKCLREKYPDLRVLYVSEEWGESTAGPAASHPHPTDSLNKVSLGRSTGVPRSASPASLPVSSKPLNSNSHIDILFVALGAPKQEEWISSNLEKIPVTAAMGVGGAFDYISGRVERAPKLLRKVGMEWAFRLVRQPWRAKRQLALPAFVVKVLKEKFA